MPPNPATPRLIVLTGVEPDIHAVEVTPAEVLLARRAVDLMEPSALVAADVLRSLTAKVLRTEQIRGTCLALSIAELRALKFGIGDLEPIPTLDQRAIRRFYYRLTEAVSAG
jgi:hypothetical protein